MDINEDEEAGYFFPPLHIQRTHLVSLLIEDYHCTKVVDIGCGEGQLIHHLRRTETVSHIVGLDIDQAALERAAEIASPLSTDYLNPRKTPLNVTLLQGSILDLDPTFTLTDNTAVTLIEVIEHIDITSISKLCHNIFYKLNPPVVIVTTPNIEFNVLLEKSRSTPSSKVAGSKFRHHDHKFEWSRAEFQQWTHAVSELYGYDAHIKGLGTSKEYSSKRSFVSQTNVEDCFGYCTQIGIFVKKNKISHAGNAQVKEENDKNDKGVFLEYYQVDFPFKKENECKETEVVYELKYYYNVLIKKYRRTFGDAVSATELLSMYKVRNAVEKYVEKWGGSDLSKVIEEIVAHSGGELKLGSCGVIWEDEEVDNNEENWFD